MKINRLIAYVIAIATLLGLGVSLFFVVDQRQYAVVSSIGGIKKIITAPGLYIKWPAPLEQVAFIDHRTQVLSFTESMTFSTPNKENVLLDLSIQWRIADPHTYFLNYRQNKAQAEKEIKQYLHMHIASVLAERKGQDFANSDYNALSDAVLARFKQESASERVISTASTSSAPLSPFISYKGIEIQNIHLQRPDWRGQNAQSQGQTTANEHAQVLATLRAQSAADIETVRFEALREREQMIFKAYEQAQIIEGKADAKAAMIEAEAARSAPEFYAFYKNLRMLQRSANKQDILIIDPLSDLKPTHPFPKK